MQNTIQKIQNLTIHDDCQAVLQRAMGQRSGNKNLKPFQERIAVWP
jgi:hypothetical protein